MNDRLTQLDLLPPSEKSSGWKRFCRAAAALPQYRAIRRFLRGILRPLCAGIRLAALQTGAHLRLRISRSPAVHSIVAWAKRFRRNVLALPQFQFLQRVHRYNTAHPAVRFLACLVLTALIEIPLCLSCTQTSYKAYTYLVVDGTGPQVVRSYPDEDRELPLLTISSDTAPGDAQLVLHKGQAAVIRHGSICDTVICRRETVANLLRRLHIAVADDEMIAVNVAGTMPIIHISDELRYERSAVTFSPYNTRTYSNYLLEKGTYRIVQEGKPGCITDTYEDVYRKGDLIESHLVARSDDSAVTQIVEYGHLAHTMEQDMRAVKDHPFRDGSGGYLVFENGDSMIYTKKVINNSTAYSGGTRTYTGHAVGMGVIAVDPKVYPYHTSMYIGSVSGGKVYGIGTAYDCGGAVKGNIIDVWFPTYGDCVPWGRRDITCYILQDTNVT